MELFTLLPIWYQYIVVGVLGLIVGSFLNVVIYRFNTGASLNGSSHCLSCGERLRWFELVPVVSYFVLRGRCRHCKSRIPLRYVVVEVGTALLFVTAYTVATSLGELVALWGLVSLLVVLVVYDINHFIIPDRLVILLAVLGGLLYVANTSAAMLASSLVLPALGASVAFLFFGGLWLFSRGRWVGFGDVKLVVPLGFMVGITGVFSWIVLSFWVGAAISIMVMAYQRHQQGKTYKKNRTKQLTIKSEVPFAPFLVLAFLLVYFGNVDVLQLFLYL